MNESMEPKKRERASNFESGEIKLLLSLVERYKQIIENKKTDSVTNREKFYAWRKIENSFNSCGITPNIRSWKTLKLKYDGIKKNIRKKSRLQRQEMYRTGDGPSSAPKLIEVEESSCSNIEEQCKLDEISAARLELVQLQMETARREHQYMEEEHKLKMLHLANDEKRKQEIHELLMQQMSYEPALNDKM